MDFFGEFKELADSVKPRNVSSADLPEALTVSNPVCGDQIWVQIELSEGIIDSFEYRVKGCWPVIACLEFLRSKLKFKTPQEALCYSLREFLDAVHGVPASKRHAFSLTHRGVGLALVRACSGEQKVQEMNGFFPKERLY